MGYGWTEAVMKDHRESREKSDKLRMSPEAYHREKVGKVMHEFKHHTLHSGSKRGPKVTSRKQAVAIAMSEAGKSRRKKK